ncbi:hypothetical protein LTR09_001020 [Extremus antarcticus]|uniref:Cytochrome b5 heme-binding domain-containing protein n=1 Tax=Extremus antarcticus TaxID=702011 RepID=A0AAJ0GHZ4_9PEZI|nr:hypothetical protein LTR09_001020 [Extremus antarcticus]
MWSGLSLRIYTLESRPISIRNAHLIGYNAGFYSNKPAVRWKYTTTYNLTLRHIQLCTQTQEVMSYWSITVALLSITFLVYRHPLKMLSYLPPWLRGGAPTNQQVPPDSRGGESQVKVQVEGPEDDDVHSETTPKATATAYNTNVPTLSLDGPDHDHKSSTPQASPKPVSPPSTTKPVSSSRPAATLQPSMKYSSPATLMPPPSRPSMAPPPSPASSLRVPSNGPVPNRGIPSNSQQRVSSGNSLASTATLSAPNPRGKVLLGPGHSPMDWAALIRKSNLSGVSTFQRVTPSMLKSMSGRKGKPAWSSWQGKVYNITPYLDFHPGGRNELMKAAGRDGTNLFMEVHPWVNWENMLGSCMVGVLVPEGAGNGGSELEEMD